MRPRIVGPFTGLLLLLATALPTAAYAGLAREGPTSTTHGFPEWYQDKTGLIMDFCSPTNEAELAGGWCLLLPPVPASAPEVFPSNFSDEHFYYEAAATTTGIVNGQPVTALLTLALEAAFAQGPVVAGDQLVFGRVRVLLDNTPVTGTYNVVTPFGTVVINDQVAGQGRIFWTEDLGVACAQGRFDCALASAIGPFLLPSPFPGGPELPPVPVIDAATGCGPDATGATICDPYWPFGGVTAYPGTGRKYVTDPSRVGPVTGSVLPPYVSPVDGVAYEHNIFRIEVIPADGSPPLLVAETTNFSLMGRIFEGTVAGRVTLDRASYARPAPTPSGNKLDVFATALPAATGRVPPFTAQLPAQPILVFYDAPCAVDATGALKAPVDPVTGQTLPHTNMSSALGWKYVVGQSAPAVIPPAVCVEQTNGFDVNGNAVSLFSQAPVTDQVFLTAADFDPNAGTLTVMASSSDRVFPPILTVAGVGTIDAAAGQLVATRAAPPNRVTVISSAGGLNQRLVKSQFLIGAGNSIVANADAYTLAEDSPATVLAVQANDTMGGSEMPPGSITTLVTTPLLGTAVVNLDGTVTYTPNANAFGTDQFSYSLTLNGVVSNTAAATITLTPVNDLPVAVNDNFAAVVNPLAPTAVSLNVLANDTDADGPGDLGDAVNLVLTSAPAGAVWSVTGGVGGAVSFTANIAGTYTFTYQAQDKGGKVVPPVLGVSNIATATVVASGETVTIARAEFIVSKNRWRVEGSANPSANQTITLSYLDGPNAGFVFGTARVAGGLWALDATATGLQIPTTAGATRIVATGPGGGRAVATFRLK